ncbi:MAG: type II toxin-antitoxin system VapC family toxin [Betaproteobacteria bacterium]|nr:type II toxin-antitoxin system VapC family toxin [Betaproteobacteria bacterium]
MVVVDTNILAYLLIEGDRTKQAQALFAKDSDWRSEAFLLVEFSNVLATYRRMGALSSQQTESLLTEAARRVRELLSVPNLRALRRAERFAVSAYDARFLAAADTLGGKLVTEDAKLRAAAPDLTRSLAQALAA